MSQSRRRALFAVFALVWPLLLGPSLAHAGASLETVSGLVQVRRVGANAWELVQNVPLPLSDGDELRSGSRAKATVVFPDGSRVDVDANSSFLLREAQPSVFSMSLALGSLKAYVQKLASRRFEVHTPTAVCAVRGTEFKVEVLSGGRTVIDLYKGLLGVQDRKGQQVLLHPNERLQVDLRGLGGTGAVPSQGQLQRSQFHTLMQREMALSLSKEEVQAAAAREIKLAEYQQGKVLTDAFGQRVRLEEYIVRPSPNQFKFVVLNERQARFDYFYYLGTFNTALPTDMSIALRQLPGSVGTPPTWYLTAFQTGRSNTQDSVVEMAQGGHPVDVNHNADPSDDVSSFFDAAKNAYADVTGQSVYQTLFDKYGFYVNGNLKYGWTGTNLQTYAAGLGIVPASNTDPITGAALAQALPVRSVSSLFPDPNQIHQQIYESYSDGTFLQWDNYIISDQGRIATMSDFQSPTSGVTYRDKILNFNYEQVLTASEFGGRKIDLVVEPKIFVQSGLIQ